MNEIKDLLKQIFTSKKALAAIVGLCAIGAKKAGLQISEDTLYQILGIIGTYVVGQGIADSGKEAAKISAEGATVSRDGSLTSIEIPDEISAAVDLLLKNPRLGLFAAKVLEAKATEIDETVDGILEQCTIDLRDTVIPPKGAG